MTTQVSQLGDYFLLGVDAVSLSLSQAYPPWMMACYHDVMARRATTVRMPEELAETAEIVARGRGISVNALVLEALQSEIERVKEDTEFMEQLRALTERDKEILDRLAE